MGNKKDHCIHYVNLVDAIQESYLYKFNDVISNTEEILILLRHRTNFCVIICVMIKRI